MQVQPIPSYPRQKPPYRRALHELRFRYAEATYAQYFTSTSGLTTVGDIERKLGEAADGERDQNEVCVYFNLRARPPETLPLEMEYHGTRIFYVIDDKLL